MIKWMKTNLLPLGVIIAVVISVVLSISVWINPYQANRIPASNSTSSTNDSLTSMGSVYQANQVVVTKQDGSQQLLYNQKRNPALTIQQALTKAKMSGLNRVANGDSGKYLDYLRMTNTVTISFPDQISMTVFNQVFDQSLDADRLATVNYVVVPLNDRSRVYLLADQGKKVYRVKVDQLSLKTIKQSLKGGRRVDVDHKIVNGTPILSYPHEYTLPTYSYDVSQHNVDNLAQTLLATANSNTIDTERNGNQIIYTNGNSHRMTYNRQTGSIQYDNYLGKDQKYGRQSLESHLYNRLKKLSIDLTGIYFDTVSQAGQTVTYRSFVQGFPIFSSRNYGTILIKSNNDGMERYQLSNYYLGLPQTSDGTTVTMPSSAVVSNALKESGQLKKVKGMRIGYTWNNDDTETVTLEPTYYVYYNGNWVPYQTLLKEE